MRCAPCLLRTLWPSMSGLMLTDVWHVQATLSTLCTYMYLHWGVQYRAPVFPFVCARCGFAGGLAGQSRPDTPYFARCWARDKTTTVHEASFLKLCLTGYVQSQDLVACAVIGVHLEIMNMNSVGTCLHTQLIKEESAVLDSIFIVSCCCTVRDRVRLGGNECLSICRIRKEEICSYWVSEQQ